MLSESKPLTPCGAKSLFQQLLINRISVPENPRMNFILSSNTTVTSENHFRQSVKGRSSSSACLHSNGILQCTAARCRCFRMFALLARPLPALSSPLLLSLPFSLSLCQPSFRQVGVISRQSLDRGCCRIFATARRQTVSHIPICHEASEFLFVVRCSRPKHDMA